jgi:metal-sulfur cluster biosynthetic enzyme
MGQHMAQDIKTKVESRDDVNQAFVEVTFDPPWNPAMISEEAREKLGVGVSDPQERQESNVNTEWE